MATKPKPAVAVSSRKPEKHARRRAPRYLGHVLIGVLTVIAVLVWRLPLEGKQPAQSRKIATPPQPVASDVAASDAHRRDQNALLGRAANADEPTGHKPLLPDAERAAIDAVFSGDYASARRLYRELARAKPTSPVFSEAARIVAARELPHP